MTNELSVTLDPVLTRYRLRLVRLADEKSHILLIRHASLNQWALEVREQALDGMGPQVSSAQGFPSFEEALRYAETTSTLGSAQAFAIDPRTRKRLNQARRVLAGLSLEGNATMANENGRSYNFFLAQLGQSKTYKLQIQEMGHPHNWRYVITVPELDGIAAVVATNEGLGSFESALTYAEHGTCLGSWIATAFDPDTQRRLDQARKALEQYDQQKQSLHVDGQGTCYPFLLQKNGVDTKYRVRIICKGLNQWKIEVIEPDGHETSPVIVVNASGYRTFEDALTYAEQCTHLGFLRATSSDAALMSRLLRARRLITRTARSIREQTQYPELSTESYSYLIEGADDLPHIRHEFFVMKDTTGWWKYRIGHGDWIGSFESFRDLMDMFLGQKSSRWVVAESVTLASENVYQDYLLQKSGGKPTAPGRSLLSEVAPESFFSAVTISADGDRLSFDESAGGKFRITHDDRKGQIYVENDELLIPFERVLFLRKPKPQSSPTPRPAQPEPTAGGDS